jgi:hypothetical protein
MSEIAPSQPIVAQALPQTTPSTAPNSTTPSTEQTPATPRGVNTPNVAAEKAEILKRADEAITVFAQKAGLPAPKIETHLDRVKNAIDVYAKLVSSGKTGEATEFLKAMGQIGEKFGLNFGLSTPPAQGQGGAIALNADKFKGVDAQNPYHQVQQELYAETKPAAVKPGTTQAPDTTGNPRPTATPRPNAAPDLRGINLPEVVSQVTDSKSMITVASVDKALKANGLEPADQKLLQDLLAQLKTMPENTELPSATVLKAVG